MKSKFLIAGVLIFISLAFNACEVLSDCKTCRQVTYIDGAWDHEDDPVEYCGAVLISIEAMDDYVNGNIRTTWECD